MPFPDLVLEPVRRQLTQHGLSELRTPAEVDAALAPGEGTALVAVNSMCGCSSGRMRPALLTALQGECRPDRLFTVFAGQDLEATARAREYFAGYAPSSPSLFLFRDGKLVWAMERKHIEGRDPADVAQDIQRAFERWCAPVGEEDA